jgi:hypothetical protein
MKGWERVKTNYTEIMKLLIYDNTVVNVHCDCMRSEAFAVVKV